MVPKEPTVRATLVDDEAMEEEYEGEAEIEGGNEEFEEERVFTTNSARAEGKRMVQPSRSAVESVASLAALAEVALSQL